MVKISEIKDQPSLQAWLLDRDEEETLEFARVIASRAALRVLPEWWDWVLTGNSVKNKNVSALPVLRCNLIPLVARRWPIRGIQPIADSAANSVTNDYTLSALEGSNRDYSEYSNAADAVQSAFYAVLGIATDKLANDFAAVEFATAVFHEFVPGLWGSIRYDCEILAKGEMKFFSPLWPTGDNPFLKKWDSIQAAAPPDWQFWIDWYQAELDGTPQNQELLTEVALIADEDWQKGAVHINRMIAGIEARYALLNEVREMRAEISALRAGRASRETRRGNHPPELVEDEADLSRSVEIVRAGLGEAEQELEKTIVNPERLKQAGLKILAGIKAVVKYMAGLGDIALTKAVEEGGAALGKWGVRGVGAYLVAQEPHVASLAERLIEFAGKIF